MTIKEEIENVLVQGKSIIFCGAGISRNSGIPIVVPLVEYIFQKLGVEEMHAKKYIESGFVFEAFMEGLSEKTSIVPLLKVFDNNLLNLNHLLIAKLVRKKLVDFIITTNFDENIENAFLSEGLIPNEDFDVCNIASFERGHDTPQKTVIIKLHGTISDMDSISTTISRISRKENREPIAGFFRQLFSEHSHHNILFLGYSFSDDFDVTPALLSEYNKSKELFNISHIGADQNEMKCTQLIGNGSRKIPVETFCINTDALVFHLHKELFFEKDIIKHEFDWHAIVDHWFRQEVNNTGLKNRHSIIWEIFFKKGDFVTLEFYLAKLNADETQENALLKIDYLTKKAAFFAFKKEYKKAIPLYEEAIKNATKGQTGINVAVHTGNLATIYEREGNLPTALKYIESTLHYFEGLKKSQSAKDQLTASQELCGYQTTLARIYRKLKRFSEAEQVYDDIFRECQKEGFLRIEEMAHFGNGILKIELSQLEESLECFYRSYRISKNLKLEDRIHHSFKKICWLLNQLHGYEKSNDFYNAEVSDVKKISGYSASLDEILTAK